MHEAATAAAAAAEEAVTTKMKTKKKKYSRISYTDKLINAMTSMLAKIGSDHAKSIRIYNFSVCVCSSTQ